MVAKRSLIVAFALAALAGACSEGAPVLPPMQASLPTEADLPHDVNQNCGCVRDGECVVLEEIPGYWQVRNLSCRWLRPNAVARCDFERRFVELTSDAQGNLVTNPPGPWEARSLRAILLPDGRWCAG